MIGACVLLWLMSGVTGGGGGVGEGVDPMWFWSGIHLVKHLLGMDVLRLGRVGACSLLCLMRGLREGGGGGGGGYFCICGVSSSASGNDSRGGRRGDWLIM